MTLVIASEPTSKSRKGSGSSRAMVRSRTSDFRHLADLLPNDVETRAKARAEAARRGWTVEQLARRILETVMEDGLVGAVLDDAKVKGRRR